MWQLSRLIRGLVLALLLLVPAVPRAAPVVVELFTSQGCNACPPADALLARLADRDDVVALSLHVDYWDYLGWRDTFARREFTERQFAYRDAWGRTVVYTPQMVVQGVRDVDAVDPVAVAAAIAAAGADEAPVEVAIDRRDGMLLCRIATSDEAVRATIWLAKYRLRATVEITRGENAGRTITYRNVVTSLDRMGEWQGGGGEDVTMPQPGPGEGVAIWLQEGRAGRILAAAKVERPD